MKLTLALAVGSFGFGAFGLWKYEHDLHPQEAIDLWSVSYHSLQLLILHAPHLEHEVPWQLHVGRFLGAAFDSLAAFIAVLQIFPDAWNTILLSLPLTRPHVVVCGLGATGTQVALEARRKRQRVVAIEHACPADVRQLMRAKGVLVLDGDATDGAKLRAARVHRAAFVVAACPKDKTNVAIASAIAPMALDTKRSIAKLFRRSRRDALVCRALIRDGETRQLLARVGSLTTDPSRYRVDVSDLDRDAVAARQALDRHPLDFQSIDENDDVLVHLVVVGCGSAGRALALQGAGIGHFANEVGRLRRRLRLTLVDEPEAENTLKRFESLYPDLDYVCDILRRQMRSEEDLERVLTETTARGAARTLTTYAFCNDSANGDRINLRRALILVRQLQGQSAQILVRQTGRDSLAELLGPQLREALQFPRLYPFGMFEDVLEWNVVLHDSEDRLARELHVRYRLRRLAEGEPERTQPTWEALSDEMRNSNRQAADHIRIKLRALGYEDAPLDSRKGQRIEGFTDREIDLLARLEHVRWCAERRLAGWTYGPTSNRAKKINHCLINWDALPENERRKDPEQITGIPPALDSVGRGIYRQPSAPPDD